MADHLIGFTIMEISLDFYDYEELILKGLTLYLKKISIRGDNLDFWGIVPQGNLYFPSTLLLLVQRTSSRSSNLRPHN